MKVDRKRFALQQNAIGWEKVIVIVRSLVLLFEYRRSDAFFNFQIRPGLVRAHHIATKALGVAFVCNVQLLPISSKPDPSVIMRYA